MAERGIIRRAMTFDSQASKSVDTALSGCLGSGGMGDVYRAHDIASRARGRVSS